MIDAGLSPGEEPEGGEESAGEGDSYPGWGFESIQES